MIYIDAYSMSAMLRNQSHSFEAHLQYFKSLLAYFLDNKENEALFMDCNQVGVYCESENSEVVFRHGYGVQALHFSALKYLCVLQNDSLFEYAYYKDFTNDYIHKGYNKALGYEEGTLPEIKIPKAIQGETIFVRLKNQVRFIQKDGAC